MVSPTTPFLAKTQAGVTVPLIKLGIYFCPVRSRVPMYRNIDIRRGPKQYAQKSDR